MFDQTPLFALRKDLLYLGTNLFALTNYEQVIWSKTNQQLCSQLVNVNTFFGFFF